MARFCPSCGVGSGATARAVRKTTARLGLSGTTDGETAERLTLLCQYLPTPLVQHLMTERRAPVGQRAVAAVVFADISGFTAMSEQLDPEEVLEIMNGCFEGLVEAVERYGGVVDKFIGDCLMATFGIPSARDDDAERAVRACMEMHTYLEQYNRSLDEPLGLAIGVNYGPLVAGNLGSRTRMDFTVMGDVVNIAQRLESAATAGQILVSAAVERAARAGIRFDRRPPVTVKGKRDPLTIFAVAGLRSERSNRQRPRMIGREALLRAIAATTVAIDSPFILVDLFGEAGIGKTRLAEEAAEEWRRNAGENAHVVAVSASGHGPARPYGAIGLLVEAACDVTVGDAAATRHRKLERLRELGVDESWRMFLEHAVTPARAGMGALDNDALELGMLGATRALFERLAARRDLVVVDGLERLDTESFDIFSRLWPEQPPPGLLMLTTRLADASVPFAHPQWLRAAQVPPLTREESDALIGELLAVTAIPNDTGAALYAESSGYPRYLIELLATLDESSHIVRASTGLTLGTGWRDAGGGAGLEGLVRARLARLTADVKLLLQAGALYGDPFLVDVASAAVGELRLGPHWLEEAASRGFVTSEGTHARFAHDLIPRLLLGGMLGEDRARLTGAVGAALEASPAGSRPEALPRLARLFADSTDADKAVHYLERARDHLTRTGEHLRAAEIAEELVSVLGGRMSIPGAELRAVLRAARARERAGQRDRARGLYERATREAEGTSSTASYAEAQRGRARLARTDGLLADAAPLVESALAAAQRSNDVRTLVWTYIEAAELDIATGANDAAAQKLEEAQRLSATLDGPDAEGSARGRSLGRLARIALGRSDPATAERLLADALPACEAAADHHELIRLHGTLGALHRQSDPARAQTHFQHAVAVAKRIGDRLGEAKQLHNLGSFLAASGEPDSARSCFGASLTLSRALEWNEGIEFNNAALATLG